MRFKGNKYYENILIAKERKVEFDKAQAKYKALKAEYDRRPSPDLKKEITEIQSVKNRLRFRCEAVTHWLPDYIIEINDLTVTKSRYERRHKRMLESA